MFPQATFLDKDAHDGHSWREGVGQWRRQERSVQPQGLAKSMLGPIELREEVERKFLSPAGCIYSVTDPRAGSGQNSFQE